MIHAYYYNNEWIWNKQHPFCLKEETHNIKRLFLLNNYTLWYMHIIIIIKYKANILLLFLLLQIDTDFLNCEDFLVGDVTVGTQRHVMFATQQQLDLLKNARRWYLQVYSRWYRSHLHSSSPSMPSSRKTTV